MSLSDFHQKKNLNNIKEYYQTSTQPDLQNEDEIINNNSQNLPDIENSNNNKNYNINNFLKQSQNSIQQLNSQPNIDDHDCTQFEEQILVLNQQQIAQNKPQTQNTIMQSQNIDEDKNGITNTKKKSEEVNQQNNIKNTTVFQQDGKRKQSYNIETNEQQKKLNENLIFPNNYNKSYNLKNPQSQNQRQRSTTENLNFDRNYQNSIQNKNSNNINTNFSNKSQILNNQNTMPINKSNRYLSQQSVSSQQLQNYSKQPIFYQKKQPERIIKNPLTSSPLQLKQQQQQNQQKLKSQPININTQQFFKPRSLTYQSYSVTNFSSQIFENHSFQNQQKYQQQQQISYYSNEPKKTQQIVTSLVNLQKPSITQFQVQTPQKPLQGYNSFLSQNHITEQQKYQKSQQNQLEKIINVNQNNKKGISLLNEQSQKKKQLPSNLGKISVVNNDQKVQDLTKPNLKKATQKQILPTYLTANSEDKNNKKNEKKLHYIPPKKPQFQSFLPQQKQKQQHQKNQNQKTPQNDQKVSNNQKSQQEQQEKQEQQQQQEIFFQQETKLNFDASNGKYNYGSNQKNPQKNININQKTNEIMQTLQKLNSDDPEILLQSNLKVISHKKKELSSYPNSSSPNNNQNYDNNNNNNSNNNNQNQNNNNNNNNNNQNNENCFFQQQAKGITVVSEVNNQFLLTENSEVQNECESVQNSELDRKSINPFQVSNFNATPKIKNYSTQKLTKSPQNIHQKNNCPNSNQKPQKKVQNFLNLGNLSQLAKKQQNKKENIKEQNVEQISSIQKNKVDIQNLEPKVKNIQNLSKSKKNNQELQNNISPQKKIEPKILQSERAEIEENEDINKLQNYNVPLNNNYNQNTHIKKGSIGLINESLEDKQNEINSNNSYNILIKHKRSISKQKTDNNNINSNTFVSNEKMDKNQINQETVQISISDQNTKNLNLKNRIFEQESIVYENDIKKNIKQQQSEFEIPDEC